MTSEEIWKIRLDLGMTQRAFADWLGVTVTTVSRWEVGKQKIPLAMSKYIRAQIQAQKLREIEKVVERWWKKCDEEVRSPRHEAPSVEFLPTFKNVALRLRELGEILNSGEIDKKCIERECEGHF